MKPYFRLVLFSVLICLFSKGCKKSYEAEYLALKQQKDANEALVQKHLHAVSMQSDYEHVLDSLLRIDKLKKRKLMQKNDLYLSFTSFPPFNQDIEIYVVVSNTQGSELHYISYNIDHACNIVTGHRALDASCIVHFEHESKTIPRTIVDSLIYQLDYYEFWNLKEEIYNKHEFVVVDGYAWEIEGIKFRLDKIHSANYENKIYRKIPSNYHSIHKLGNYISSLK